MKILIISNMGPIPKAPQQGIYVEKQVERLKQSGADVSYFNLKWNSTDSIRSKFKYPLFFLRFIFRHVLSVNKFDLVHIHYYFPTIICAVLYKIFRNNKVKILVTCHGTDVYSYQPAGWLYKKLSNLVDHWFFTSANLYQRFDGTVKSKTILCAGYDDLVFKAPQQQLTKSIDCLFVGVIEHNKGCDRLIWLVKNMPHVKFAAAGIGLLMDDLIQCANVCSNLTVLGKKEPSELVAVMQSAKFLLSLSRNESFGLVIAEAHACKTPCIVTKTDGSMTQLPDWKYMTSQQQDEADIRKGLKKHINAALVLSMEEYQQIQTTAFQKTQGFSLSNVIKVIEEQYTKL
jgi:glycosyltransferase involved in cell wall biosynthesis